jgi:hypothetical protein
MIVGCNEGGFAVVPYAVIGTRELEPQVSGRFADEKQPFLRPNKLMYAQFWLVRLATILVDRREKMAARELKGGSTSIMDGVTVLPPNVPFLAPTFAKPTSGATTELVICSRGGISWKARSCRDC